MRLEGVHWTHVVSVADIAAAQTDRTRGRKAVNKSVRAKKTISGDDSKKCCESSIGLIFFKTDCHEESGEICEKSGVTESHTFGKRRRENWFNLVIERCHIIGFNGNFETNSIEFDDWGRLCRVS